MAGERVGGRLGEIVEQGDLDMVTMIDKIFGTPTTATPPTATPTATPDER
jgi:hypothetical protein